MSAAKLRVMLDLSMAARGFCGIAQDVRLLYKTLATCPDVEVTGLIYHPRALAAAHKFRPPDRSRADRLANQACFLWSLAEEDNAWPDFRPWRILKKIHGLATTATMRRARLDLLDRDMLRDVVWRLLFSKSLSANDFSLVHEGMFALSNLSDGVIYARGLTRRKPVKLDTRGYDFLIVQGPRPFDVSPGTRQIVRYHDTIPMLQPDSMANSLVIKWHHMALRQCRESTFFVCNSEPTRGDLTTVYPELSARSTTVPYMLSDMYEPDFSPALLRSIISLRHSPATGAQPRRRPGRDLRYLMCVSTVEPRKNYVGLIRAFNALKRRSQSKPGIRGLKLLIVGNPGWKCGPILAAMRTQVERGELIHLEKVPSDELRVLYSHAAAFVFPSFAEGFGFPPLEAMMCDTPVVASDIPAHRWALGDAALYCDPHDVESIADTMERVVPSDESAALRNHLVARGRERVKLYSISRCETQWLNLFDHLKCQPPRTQLRPSSTISESGLLKRAA